MRQLAVKYGSRLSGHRGGRSRERFCQAIEELLPLVEGLNAHALCWSALSAPGVKTGRCCAGAAQASDVDSAAVRSSADVRISDSLNTKSRCNGAEPIVAPLESFEWNSEAERSDGGHTTYGGRRHVDPRLQSQGAARDSITCARLIVRQAGQPAR
jgi:hypothetical protein